MEEATSKFNINFVREVFVIGETQHAQLVMKLCKSYYFLHPRAGLETQAYRDEVFFVVAACDFSSPQKMQELARDFLAIDAPLAHRIVYVTAPNGLSREQLLFAQEIGARYVCAGPGKNEELKEYLKRICVEAHQVGSLTPFEMEIEAAAKANDRAALHKTAEKLKTLPESEEGLRLLVVVHTKLNDVKRIEAFLKRLLALNHQNLWAANCLGKHYLRNGRAAEGIELLRKLSQFHELNSERLLTLGNAQVIAGKTQEAEAAFEKGEKLAGGNDERFKEGLAKVKLAEKDYQGALVHLGDKPFTEDVISFLNMRAILAIRGGNFEEGLQYYGFAAKGAAADKDVKAKLLFNMGLAYVRLQDLDRAQECFRESCALGGPRFQRAKGPLEKVATVIKNAGKGKKSSEPMKLEDTEWETLF